MDAKATLSAITSNIDPALLADISHANVTLKTTAMADAVILPGWVGPTPKILYGLAAVTRSKPLSAFAICNGLYWVFDLARHPPQGEDFLGVYLPATRLFAIVGRTLEAVLLQDANDFKRKRKEKTNDKKDDKKEVEEKRGIVQICLDALELGFAAIRGIGW